MSTTRAVDAATATMISLIGSLADNTVALGRRYGEWAISAPTIESAVNLVVDGILTTFLATARERSIAPLAQRARKILQEEGGHRAHAEAWLKRICRTGGADADLLCRRIGEFWERAAQWPGPEDDPGYQAAISRDMVSLGPNAVRRRIRDWLSGLLDAEGASVALDDPTEWSTREETKRQWSRHLSLAHCGIRPTSRPSRPGAASSSPARSAA